MLEWFLLMVAISWISAMFGAASGNVSIWHRLGAMCMGMAFSQSAFVASLCFGLGHLGPVSLFAITGVPYFVAKEFVNPSVDVQKTEG